MARNSGFFLFAILVVSLLQVTSLIPENHSAGLPEPCLFDCQISPVFGPENCTRPEEPFRNETFSRNAPRLLPPAGFFSPGLLSLDFCLKPCLPRPRPHTWLQRRLRAPPDA